MAQMPEIPADLAPIFEMTFDELWDATLMQFVLDNPDAPVAVKNSISAARVAGDLEWNNEDPQTPLSAERLSLLSKALVLSIYTSAGYQADTLLTRFATIESRSAALQTLVEDLQSEVGAIESGQDGADGFPTEAQWSDLLARVEALEAPAG